MDNKKQINLRLDEELYNFLVKYSKKNYKTVTSVIREMIADLYNQNINPLVVDENNEPIILKKY